MPSKFQNERAEELYDLSLGGSGEQIGSVDELGWYALFAEEDPPVILRQDIQGFVYLDEYETIEEATDAWAVIVADYEVFNTSEEV